MLFARNRLCALVRPGLMVTSETLLAAMLDPQLKLGTSTPKADPAGDYTWAMFAKAESVRAGSRATLEGKALRLMGGATSEPPPAGMDLFAWHLREHRADIFLAYCSAGAGFVKDLPGASVVALPPALATGADYGLTVLAPRNEACDGARPVHPFPGRAGDFRQERLRGAASDGSAALAGSAVSTASFSNPLPRLLPARRGAGAGFVRASDYGNIYKDTQSCGSPGDDHDHGQWDAASA